MKKPTSDEAYITMVGKLEKIKKDLKAIDVEVELNHEEIISKVEERLPEYVRKKWREYCADNELFDQKDTRGMFDTRWKFQNSYREMANYVVGDPKTVTSKSKFCVVTKSVTVASAALVAEGEEVKQVNKPTQRKEPKP